MAKSSSQSVKPDDRYEDRYRGDQKILRAGFTESLKRSERHFRKNGVSVPETGLVAVIVGIHPELKKTLVVSSPKPKRTARPTV